MTSKTAGSHGSSSTQEHPPCFAALRVIGKEPSAQKWKGATGYALEVDNVIGYL